MYAGRVLNGTGEGCPPFYPVISSPCIQKRCAAVVTSLSASNELHMIVCIQMFFVQKNFRLPDCIHCRPNAMRSPLLVPCLYLSVALYVCLYRESLILFFISCRMPIQPCLYSIHIPLCHIHASLYMLIYFTEFFILPVPSRPLLLYQLLLPHVPYPAPSVGEGERRVIPILSDKSTTSLCMFLRPKQYLNYPSMS